MRQPRPIPAFPPGQFCFRREYAAAGESLWSLVHKFSVWNAIESVDLKHLLLDRSMTQSERKHLRTGASIWDLRSDLGYDRDQLRTMFHDPAGELLNDATMDRIDDNTAFFGLEYRWSEHVLRFCPKCYARGLHFSLFASEELRRCPFHGVELTIRCPKCSDPISTDITAFDGSDGARCGCGATAWDQQLTRRRREEVRLITDKLESTLHGYKALFVKSRDVLLFGTNEGQELRRNSAAMLAVAADLELPDGFQREKSEVMTVLPPRPKRRGRGEDSFNARLEAEYRLYRRKLFESFDAGRKSLVGVHVRQLGDFDGSNRAIEVPPRSDPAVMGYLVWRLFWERTRFPERIVYRKLRSLGEAINHQLQNHFLTPSYTANKDHPVGNLDLRQTLVLRFLEEAFAATLYECFALVTLLPCRKGGQIRWSSVSGCLVRTCAAQLRRSGAIAILRAEVPGVTHWKGKWTGTLNGPSATTAQKMENFYQARLRRLVALCEARLG